jgi:hypothetical protein
MFVSFYHQKELHMEKELSGKESLALITEMISRAKKEAAGDGGFHLLLWGWVIAICDFAHYGLAKAGFGAPYVVWLLVVPATVISAIKSRQLRKQSRVKSHIDTVLTQLWMVVYSVIIVMVVFMSVVDFNHNPVILMISGIGVFMTGALLKEKSLKLGALMLGIGAIIGFLMPVDEQYLVAGIAMVLGYLVPGYYLKKSYREQF